MSPNTVVQIDSKGILDKSLHGVLGLVKETRDGITKVNIYSPGLQGHNASVRSIEIPTGNLYEIGTARLKPL